MDKEKTYQRVIIRELEIEGFGKIIIGFGAEFPERVGIGMNIEIARNKLLELEQAVRTFYEFYNKSVVRITNKSVANSVSISHVISEYLDLSKEEI